MRVFAALPLSSEIRKLLSEAMDKLGLSYKYLKMVPEANLHITLHFFGEIDEEKTEKLKSVLDDPLLTGRIIKASLGRLGFFPARSNPRVIFCTLKEGAEEVVSFRKTFNEIIHNSGLAVEEEGRSFTPHITLARNKGGRIDPHFLNSFDLEQRVFLFDRLILYQSILRSTGAEHSPLKTLIFTREGK
ncbi:RNA 2',3'-cyclic phosphodiesterase [subsurface metagenome]